MASSGQAIYGELLFQPSRLISEKGIPRGDWWKQEANPPFDNIYTASWKNFYARASGNSISKGCVEVWNMRKKKRLWLAPLRNQSARAIAISPDGQLLAVGTIQGYVFSWQLQTGRLLARNRYSDLIDCLAFSPNSRVLAADCGTEQMGGGVRLLDCASHKLLAVLSVAFPENSVEKDWTLDHPDWFAALPDQSYVASDSVVQRIRMPGKVRDAAFIRRFHRPRRVRAALRKCYAGS